MAPEAPAYLIPIERIESAIHEVRGLRVVMARDLAALYGVSTRALNQAVKRNRERFPADFAFQLAPDEWQALRSQFVTLKRGEHAKYLPYAFTEHGTVMAATLLKTQRAAQVSVFVVRAFVRMRRMLADQRQFALKLAELESKFAAHDTQLKVVFDAIRQLMHKPKPEPEKTRRQIGFQASDGRPKHEYGRPSRGRR
jgi:hypothetical protein